MKAQTWFPVLDILASGRLMSGAVIGEALGLTRAAIWQRVVYLRDLGVPIVSSEVGYQLQGGAYLPAAPSVEALVSLPVTCVTEVDSTNTQVMANRPREQCLIAIYQQAGQGRRGRSWIGVPGRTLMLSVGVSLRLPVARLAGLSIAIGVALCELLRAEGAPVELKWPNDLWVGERKLAGFLIEVQGGVHDAVFVVVGLGLNLKSIEVEGVDTVAIEEILRRSWSDADTAGVISVLEQVMRGFGEQDRQALVDAFGRVSALTGKAVTVSDGAEDYRGIMAGIDPDGALLLMTDNGVLTLMAGDVTVRSSK